MSHDTTPINPVDPATVFFALVSRGWSQHALAEEAGVSRRCVERWLQGRVARVIVAYARLVRLAQAGTVAPIPAGKSEAWVEGLAARRHAATRSVSALRTATRTHLAARRPHAGRAGSTAAETPHAPRNGASRP